MVVAAATAAEVEVEVEVEVVMAEGTVVVGDMAASLVIGWATSAVA